MHGVKGKGHTIDERVPDICVFRRKPDVEKIFLPPTIKYTPHPERAEKIKTKTACSEGRGFHSKSGRNSFTQKHLVKLFSWSIAWGQGS